QGRYPAPSRHLYAGSTHGSAYRGAARSATYRGDRRDDRMNPIQPSVTESSLAQIGGRSMRTKVRILRMVVVAALLCVGIVSADDGVIFRRNISKTPESESGEAAMSMMEFYVPAQAADGTLL